jgi:hypothetical protein
MGRPRRRWADNIKMALREVGWDCRDWVDLAEDRDQWGGSCESGNEPSGFIKRLEVLEWLHSWQLLKKAQLHE